MYVRESVESRLGVGIKRAARWRRGEREHVARCLNVLRQFALCDADVALEPPDAFAHNYTQSRAGGEHVCMDWPGFYEEMKANYMAWQEVQERFVESG